MEQRTPSYLSTAYAGKLVPAESHRFPLLPYERQLLQALGISEQEYREFEAEVRQKCLERPAGYEHIPDIRNDPTGGILTSIIVGSILTAVSALLAPKPKQPSLSEQDSVEQRTLPNQQGRTRFNNSVGFDAAPGLAQLGSRVPIPFGRYFETDPRQLGDLSTQQPTGGIIAEPLLVWSRMTSHGSYQTLKALAVIGQSVISEAPALEGVLIGGQPVANFYESNYAVFYKSDVGDNRIFLSDLKYGDAAEGNSSASGIFSCPTLSGTLEAGFSMASSPANTTSFGVYQTIPNGGHFRVNWRVISNVAEKDGKKRKVNDPKKRAQMERRKIAGKKADEYFDNDSQGGMPGTGRAYSLKMGLFRLNNSEYELPTVLSVNRGDIVDYRIDGGQFDNDNCSIDTESGVVVDDINNTSNDMRQRADELLQIGEIFMINRTMFRVIERPSTIWERNQTQDYKLKVINFTGANREIGLIGKRSIRGFVLSEGNTAQPDEGFKGSGYYPLHKVDLGQARNTRATEVTEIGIRSRVFAQANGLCNFNAVPSPASLRESDENLVQLTSPTMAKYLKRTSFFMVAVKDIKDQQGLGPGGEELSDTDDLFEGFDILGDVTFAITGNSPVDKFNYIRVKAPNRKEYEFRLVPKCSTNLLRYESVQNQNIYTLDTSGPQRSVTSASPHYGSFQLSFNAHIRPFQALFDLDEMRVSDQAVYSSVTCTNNVLSIQGIIGDSGGGWYQAWLENILGNLKPTSGNSSKKAFDERVSANHTFTDQGVTVTVEISAIVLFMGESHLLKNGTAKAWGITDVRVVNISGLLFDGMVLDSTITLGPTWYTNQYGRSGQEATLRFNSSSSCVENIIQQDYEREFENAAQIKEISAYEELTHSCDDSPEHEIVYINESSDVDTLDPNNPSAVPNYFGLTMFGLKLRSQNQVQSFRQLQVWLPNGISVDRLDGSGFGPSNNFADLAYWLLTQEGKGVGQEISSRLVDRDSFVQTAKFIDNYWMNFDGAISAQVNLRSYLTQTAPMFLCNFVIKNGKFALIPALPVDSAGIIIQGQVPIKTIFTDGNMIDGSFSLDYLDQSEREDFRAVMKYRRCEKNSLTTEESVLVRWNTEGSAPPKQEVFDMSNYCTRRSHAFVAARYLLSIRKRVDHIVRFQTTPNGLDLAPGDYIRIETAAAPYNSLYNGVVQEDGSIVTPIALDNGSYAAYIYRQGSSEVVEETINVTNNIVSDATLANSLINIPSIARRFGVYVVEELSLDEDGLVNITASHFPVFPDQTSKIVDDVLTTSNFALIE